MVNRNAQPKFWYTRTLLVAVAFLMTSQAGAISPYGSFGKESTIDPAVMQIDELKHLGNRLQFDFPMVDSEGEAFTLGEMMGKPLILLLSYYDCDGSCPTLNRQLLASLKEIDRFDIGPDYRVLTVSFDRLDTPKTLSTFVDKMAIPRSMQQGWRHAMLKAGKEDIDRLTQSIGYNYFWSRSDEMFLHPNVLVFLTPQGRVARYLYGTNLDAGEIERALVDADWERISNSSNVIDILVGVCYSYNFQEGKYTVNYALVIGVSALLFGVGLLLVSFIIYRNKRIRRLSHG